MHRPCVQPSVASLPLHHDSQGTRHVAALCTANVQRPPSLHRGHAFACLTVCSMAARPVRKRNRQAVKRCLRAAAAAYEVIPREGCAFGGYVHGFDVRQALGDDEIMEQIRKDMHKHRLLVFHGQTELEAEDHIRLSEQLGSLDHILHRPHPKSPDPRLLRVSNDDREGFVSVGTSGWHVDGVMLQTPFAAQTMHHIHAIPGGDTYFLGMNELLQSLDPEFREKCERLWFVSGVGEDLASGEGQMSLLPLVYKHPFTGVETMCFHLGQTYCLGWFEEVPMNMLMEAMADVMTRDDKRFNDTRRVLKELLAGPNNDSPANYRPLPPRPVQEALQQAIDELSGEQREKAVLCQQWQAGDLALIDNMALAHLPSKGTQMLPLTKGLRLFHRTTMVNPEAVPRNLRGAESVLLSDSAGSAAAAAGAMRTLIGSLISAAPPDFVGDASQLGGEQRPQKNVSAREEALRALEQGGHSLDILKEVDEEVNAVMGNEELLTKTLKKLMRELHPDRNQHREKEIVPVFKYLRQLRKDQGKPTSVLAKTKDRVVSRLRKKAEKTAVAVGPIISG
eukprot:TRINITY_DN41596_c0_g1_i1.p1 TRINITY_DN41596_c0_g1~~TRINITY_DN41596_c0_g1_i1.p1  ORF type:complete len:575 (+),score=127.87 TRINITY_DN41596_c0_g1_i1:34-1725(+)